MTDFEKIGARLKELRGGLSQKEFSKNIGSSFRAYQRYESGERMPPGGVLSKIANMSNVTTDWILTGDEESLNKKLAELELKHTQVGKKLEKIKKKVRIKLSKTGIPIPKDITSFIEIISFYEKHKIDILSLLEKHVKKIGLSEESINDKDAEELINLKATKTAHEVLLKNMGSEDRGEVHNALEKEYVDKLLTIFKNKDEGTISTITHSINTCLKVPDRKEPKTNTGA